MARVMPPGGISRGLVEPAPRSAEEGFENGRPLTFTWFDPPFRPDPPHCNQAYGVCFTGDGMIVLAGHEYPPGYRYWNLLGGGVEEGESLEDCLVREVMEEGCARVVECRYIGCQRVDDPEHPAGPARYYQSRFWARVELSPWNPRHEIDERRLVSPEDFRRALTWGSAPTAGFILEAGLRIEGKRGPRQSPSDR